jgi:malonyl-CoA O-methyltransferase
VIRRLFERLTGRRAETPLAEIRRSFETASADEAHFPSSIDARIQHVRAVVEATRDAARVLDAGCGKGRFARVVKDENAVATVAALDLAESMLRAAPADLARCCGSLTQLPFRDDSFDAAYATESLEHAVDIERAVDELCRVVRPGGRIVIIDKNAEHWGRLETPPWERWFRAGELERLLRRRCREASCAPISYWEDVPPDGLFLCWRATR